MILILHENGIKRNKIYAPDQGEKSQMGLFFGGRWVHFIPAPKLEKILTSCHSIKLYVYIKKVSIQY
jgi:hypothetical protein